MEFLKDTEQFGVGFVGFEDEDPEKLREDLTKLKEDLTKLLSFIERRVFNRISKRVNFLLTSINDQQVAIVADGNDDKDTDDNWRIIVSSGNFIFQKRVSGTWKKAYTISGS